MTKPWRWVMGAAAVAIAGVSAGYVYRMKREADQVANLLAEGMLHGYVAKGVAAEAWSRIRVGMTKEQVQALLGEPPNKKTTSLEHVNDSQDWWEYGYVSSVLAPVPDNRSYVVYFSRSGSVVSFRAPTP